MQDEVDTEPEIRVRLSVAPDVPTPRMAAEKVALFRSIAKTTIGNQKLGTLKRSQERYFAAINYAP